MNLDANFFKGSVDEIWAAHGGILLSIGHNQLNALAGIIFILYTGYLGLTGGMRNFIVQYAGWLILATFLLNYYDQPTILLGGYSVHEFFPALAEFLSAFIGQARQDQMYREIGKVLANLNPDSGDWAMYFIAAIVQALMWIFEALCFATTALSYGALGVMGLLGPLAIPWLVVPGFRHVFFNWMQASLQYAFYRVVAAALVYVVATGVLWLSSSVIHGNYALAHFAVIMGKIVGVFLADLVLIIRIPSLVSDLFKGASSAATNFVGTVSDLRRGRVH